jgi:hypothetical protein
LFSNVKKTIGLPSVAMGISKQFSLEKESEDRGKTMPYFLIPASSVHLPPHISWCILVFT